MKDNLEEARLRLESSVLEHHGLDLTHRFKVFMEEREFQAIFHAVGCECIVCADTTSMVGAMNQRLKP